MVAATGHRQGTLSPVVSGIVALVNSHKEVIRAQGLQRGQAADAWRLADSQFLLDFLCEVCEEKAQGFKVRSFHVLRAMEREAARSIQRIWRLRRRQERPASDEKEEPLHIENLEDLQLEAEPRVQILILGAPEDVTTAVHLDLQEELNRSENRSNQPRVASKVKTGEMEVRNTAASPKEFLCKKPHQKEQDEVPPVPPLDFPEVGTTDAAATTKPVEVAASDSQEQPEAVEGLEPSEKISELQDLWLQLQEGQRLWRQNTGHEARPAPKAFLSPARHRAVVKAPAPMNAPLPVPQGDDEPSVAPPGPASMSPVAPPGLEFKSKNEYRRKWNPRIAAQQRKEREKLLPNVQRLPAIETPKAPELVEREVKHCSHDDPMASECGSTATAGLSLSAPMDRGPELYGEGLSGGLEAVSSRFIPPEDSDDDVQMLRQKILEMNKMTADIDPSEHGAQRAGISLGAPEPPRRMAELRAAAERRLRSNKEPVQESLMDVPTKQREQRSEIPRHIRGNGAWGRSRTPGSPRATTPRGSATRTPTPRGAAYKPKHLYSSRAE